MENKEVKQENKIDNNLSNADIVNSINKVYQELQAIKENNKKIDVEKPIEKIDENFNKKDNDDGNIYIKKLDLEPFNKLNDFIFKHGGNK